MTTVAPGQVWEHVGFDGVPATGLRVRVLRAAPGGWACDYPGVSDVDRYYTHKAFERGYVLVASPRASDRSLVGAQPEEVVGALRQRAPETREETEA